MKKLLLCYILFSQFTFIYSQNLKDSTSASLIDQGQETSAFVALGALVEGVTILTKYPIPYFGIGHFLQKEWLAGSIFFGSELGLMFIKKDLKDRIGPSDFTKYPNISNNNEFYKRTGLSQRSKAIQEYSEIASQSLFYLRMIDFYSSYRTLHNKNSATNKIQLDNTSIPSLLLSPFKPKYLINPWVFVPIILSGIGSYIDANNDKPLSSANNIAMLDDVYSPNQALLFSAGINAYRYLTVAGGEEMFWRGAVQTELTEKMNPTFAIVTSSLAFGLWHIPNNGVGNGLIAALAGLYLGYRYNENGYDLGEVIATHFWLDWLPSIVELIRNPRNSRFVYSISWKF
jgi:membrane protease YdiL (CAAX protease family)